jgi:serine/threonine protein kinase
LSPTRFDFLQPPLAPGQIGSLGGYGVRKLLGRGGMGLVFLAEDPRLQRPVALKVPSPTLAADADYRRRFLREAQAAAALKSDHVVTIYQAGEDHGVPFLAMELLQGEPLERWLKRGRWPTIPQAIRLGKEIAFGLAAAHQKGLVHRDIKPANIWLEAPRGRIKILDFGLARPVQSSEPVTQTGLIMGTPAYMSPEQARGETLDARTDLFSLGCVLYELLTSEPPFRGPTAMAQLTALMVDQPKPLREANNQLPVELDDLVRRLLAKKADERPSSAASVAEGLQRLERMLTNGRTPSPGFDSSRQPVPDAGLQHSDPSPVVEIDESPGGPSVVEIDEPRTSLARPAGRTAKRRRRTKTTQKSSAARTVVFAVLGTLGLVCLAGAAMLLLRPSTGTIEAFIDHPHAQIIIERDGRQVGLLGPGPTAHIELAAGDYVLRLPDGLQGLEIIPARVTLARGDRQIVRVRPFPPPPPPPGQWPPPGSPGWRPPPGPGGRPPPPPHAGMPPPPPPEQKPPG